VTSSQELLASAEGYLQKFESDWDLSSIEKQKEVLLTRIADEEARLSEAEISLHEASMKLERLRKELGRDEPDFGSLGGFDAGSFPESVLRRLSQLQQEREQLRINELDTGQRIQNNREQFKTLLGSMESHLRSVVAERSEAVRAKRAEIAHHQYELKSVNEKQRDWTGLKRQVQVTEASYLFYQKKLEEAKANATLEHDRIGNVVVIERAIDPVAPSGIRKLTLLALAVAASLFAGLAWVSIAEFLDNRVYFAETLEAILQAPVAAVVPEGKAGGLGRWKA
jgi:uncharacterized protein involved in exopolysaccharide biosynthesis